MQSNGQGSLFQVLVHQQKVTLGSKPKTANFVSFFFLKKIQILQKKFKPSDKVIIQCTALESVTKKKMFFNHFKNLREADLKFNIQYAG